MWAQTIHVAAPGNGDQADSEPIASPGVVSSASEGEPQRALPMEKESNPEWAQTEPPAEAADDTDPLPARPMQKTSPSWARTVPAPAGGAVDENTPAVQPEATEAATPTLPPAATEPPAPTQPPAAAASSGPPAAKDLWPPDPPTEHAMPAWPPGSTISEEVAEPAGMPGAEAIPSWPLDFGSTPDTVPPALQPAEPAEAKPAGELGDRETVAAPAPEPALPAMASAPAAAPAWAPTSAAPARPAAAGLEVDWPASVAIPSWAPRIHIESNPPAQPAAAQPSPAPAWSPQPAAPVAPQPVVSQPEAPQPAAPQPAAPMPASPAVPAPPAPPSQPDAAQPPAAGRSSKPAWEVVEQGPKAGPANEGPTPEDRSYAEWFAWAKRGGAPANACHAAAQGAFEALAGGQDVSVAVQWATAAMSRPPAPVSSGRQTYCAWFSLANIDLNLDQQRAHGFATAAVQALDAGADASAAHAAGLAAAGIP